MSQMDYGMERVCCWINGIKLWGMDKSEKKIAPANMQVRYIVNVTSLMQLPDGTTYDSINIIHHICMKSIYNYSIFFVILHSIFHARQKSHNLIKPIFP